MDSDKSIKEEDFNGKINELLNYEKVRYKRKGFGFLVAILINLLFFHFGPKIMTKILPRNIENQGEFQFYFVLIWHEFIFILVNLYFAIIYYLNLPFFERYKTTSEPWPWEDNKEKFKQQLKSTFKRIFINHFILIPIVQLPNYFTNMSEFNMNMDEVPNTITIMAQVAFCVISDDFFFYIFHRILHHKKLYSYIHKVHHEYKHTVAISAEYAHWIEYLLGNLLASSVFPLLMNKNMHFVTYIIWITTITTETADGHSGYEFSWSPHRILPFNLGAEYHYFHHLTFTGNFASEFYYLDVLGNSLNKYYLKYYNELAKSDFKTLKISVGDSNKVDPYLEIKKEK